MGDRHLAVAFDDAINLASDEDVDQLLLAVGRLIAVAAPVAFPGDVVLVV